MMAFKLLFVTDVHGSDRCFRKFVNAAKFYDAQVLVLGGDLTGKAVVPIVHQNSDIYSVSYTGHERRIPASKLDSLIQEIRYNGFYPFVTTPDELAEVEADPQGTAKLFQHAIRESLEGWMSLAEERLKTLGVKVYISPGNDDDNVVNEVLNNSDFVINPEEKVVQIEDGVSILTFGFSNPTPWKSPRELPEEELGQRLSELAVRMPTDGITIYNIHVPPLDTPLDQAPMLDDTLKPIVEGGQVQTASVGSASVRELILKYQPTVALHGHVHEAAGFFSLGKTICINPGSEYNSGILRGALLNIDSKKQKVSFQLTVG